LEYFFRGVDFGPVDPGLLLRRDDAAYGVAAWKDDAAVVNRCRGLGL